MSRFQCERDDLVVEVAAYVPITNEGEPDLDVPPLLDISGDRPYYCNGCEEEFKYFSTALEHLEAQQ